MTVALRIAGPHLDVDALAQAISPVQAEGIARVGELDRKGNARTTFSLGVTLSESELPKQAVADALEMLKRIGPRVGPFLSDGTEAEVDFALFVSAMQMRSIRFEPEALRAFADYGLEVVVSAYPVGDDDD